MIKFVVMFVMMSFQGVWAAGPAGGNKATLKKPSVKVAPPQNVQKNFRSKVQPTKVTQSLPEFDEEVDSEEPAPKKSKKKQPIPKKKSPEEVEKDIFQWFQTYSEVISLIEKKSFRTV